MNTRNNQRFRAMETRIETALLELLNTTVPEKITVKMLCERADINRSTFYAHFTDIPDLLEKMEVHLQQELLESIPEEMNPGDMMFSAELLPLFLSHIRRHQNFYRIALKTRRDFPLNQGFEPLWQNVIRPRCLAAGITSEQEMMYHFVYFQAGFTMCLRRWVESGCPEPEEQVAEILLRCQEDMWKQDISSQK